MPELKITKDLYLSLGVVILLITVGMYMATLKADVKNNTATLVEVKTELSSLREAILNRTLTLNE